ncbi:hypothetical protein KPL71_021031 [Citrus sinensis]|uniref:Uncharacterized protein n=1 Tax=Citrus sinensis TaxID=2711 RepID=A0ACB8JC85_CITSI|nr:hypothetical protein KPL71_021031 [Citrus sinensis]
MLMIWIIVLNEMHGSKACLETERTALLEIKGFFISISDIGYDDDISDIGHEDEILSSWVGGGRSSDCCDHWKGVKCNPTTLRVMQLSLSHTTKVNYSYAPLDRVSLLNMSLFDPFQELQSLDLSENWFEGVYENRGMCVFFVQILCLVTKMPLQLMEIKIRKRFTTLEIRYHFNKIGDSRIGN